MLEAAVLGNLALLFRSQFVCAQIFGVLFLFRKDIDAAALVKMDSVLIGIQFLWKIRRRMLKRELRSPKLFLPRLLVLWLTLPIFADEIVVMRI